MILVFGTTGQVATELRAQAGPRQMVALSRSVADLSDPATCAAQILRHAPQAVINAAAYTAVDRAEEEEDLALTINAKAPGAMAQTCANMGIPFLHISTDYVFAGEGETPYKPSDATDPQNAYGRTKCAGEEAVRVAGGLHAILRTSWVFSEHGANFVKTMLRLMRERDDMGVVADQRGTPTWANSLAEAVWAGTTAAGVSGTFHWTDAGEASWHEFAVAIQEEALELGMLEKKIPIRAISSDEYPTPAHRPAYSVLDCSSTQQALDVQAAPWRDNLRAMLNDLQQSE